MNQATRMDSNWPFVPLAGAAWLLAVAAITVRRVGVALIPPLVFMAVSSPPFKSLLKRFSRRTKADHLWILYTRRRRNDVRGCEDIFAGGFLQRCDEVPKISTLILQIFSYRLTELGELFGNLPITKLPVKLHVIVPWMGLLLFALILRGLATKRKKISPTEVFLVCYIGILFVWPYYDARFWLPIVPLLIAYSVLAVRNLRVPKAVITIYCVIFAIIGFGVIAYSTRITFAGSKFPDRYGDGYLRPTYCAAFQTCGDGGDPQKVSIKALRLLREYK